MLQQGIFDLSRPISIATIPSICLVIDDQSLTMNPDTVLTVGNPALWIGFTVLVVGLLALDLGVFHRKSHVVGFREALGWSIFWIGLALLFNVGIWYWFGSRIGLEFLTGYLIEKALSVDNVFVFLVIFSYFSVPAAYQHKVLFFGILGALVMRAVFIVAGSALLSAFHWTIYVFGAALLVLGLKMLILKEGEAHPERNLLFHCLYVQHFRHSGTAGPVLSAGRDHFPPAVSEDRTCSGLVLCGVQNADRRRDEDTHCGIVGCRRDVDWWIGRGFALVPAPQRT